ncbi:unnamed protein product [Brassica rapa subsp. narinosa]
MDDYRDRISRLPDDFLLQILSRLPTKDVVAMSLLSKRWRFLWTLVPKLNFDVRLHDNTCPKFTKFVDRSLLLHKAPTLESLRVKIGSICHNADVDVSVWVRIAVDRGVRELDISYCPAEEPIRLPKCLFPCATLVVLKLENMSLVDASSYVCFKSLKTLHLLDVKYFDEQSLPHLLSSCYVLEDLVVQRCPGDNVKIVSVNAACLKTLTLHKSSQAFEGDDDGFLIAAPKLKRLDIEDYWGGFCYIENMPEVVEANVDVIYKTTERILGSLTSVKRLALCLMTSDAAYPTGTVFSQLIHLELCTCAPRWWDLLTRVIEDSPKLRVLKLRQKHIRRTSSPGASWKQPVSLPKGLSLETFKWELYEGTQKQKEVAKFILKHGVRLKKVIVSPKPSSSLLEKHEMLKELSSAPRGSSTCKLLVKTAKNIPKMDKISELPDALLLQILSLVKTKDRVATSLLSKRWETLWTLVPKLEFHLERGSDSEFVNRSLLLHRAPVLESFSLKVDTFQVSPLDIGVWVRTAVSHGVRELKLDYTTNEDPIRLPRSFCTCQTLLVLKLKNASLVGFSSSVCFQSLKTLHLLLVTYSDEKSLETILSSCSRLKDLVIECCPNDNVFIFTINVPSLQSLSLNRSAKYYRNNCLGFVINAPSLKYLNIRDYRGSFCLAEDMPELVEANVEVGYDKLDELMGSLTSVKRLSICSTKLNAPCPTTFQQLVHLEICTCKPEWWNLLVCLLTATPRLRVLKLKRTHKDCSKGGCWNEPGFVPDCLLTSLEYFEWRRYKGTKGQSDLVTYILRNACHLKMVKILTETDDPEEQLEMIKKLAFSPRASITCQVDFD